MKSVNYEKLYFGLYIGSFVCAIVVLYWLPLLTLGFLWSAYVWRNMHEAAKTARELDEHTAIVTQLKNYRRRR